MSVEGDLSVALSLNFQPTTIDKIWRMWYISNANMFNFYMDQLKIRDLLIEAANPECSWRRRNQIQCELSQATVAMDEDGVYKIKGQEAGLLTLLNFLYVSTVQNRPELLPTLFPTFAIICGDREEGMLIADVDWTIVS